MNNWKQRYQKAKLKINLVYPKESNYIYAYNTIEQLFNSIEQHEHNIVINNSTYMQLQYYFYDRKRLLTLIKQLELVADRKIHLNTLLNMLVGI